MTRCTLRVAISTLVSGLILVSAGFDPHRRDPLGGMSVTEEGFGGLCAVVRDVASEVGAPLGLVLEGGYDLDALAGSVLRCVEVLAGGTAAVRTDATRTGQAALKHASSEAIKSWKV